MTRRAILVALSSLFMLSMLFFVLYSPDTQNIKLVDEWVEETKDHYKYQQDTTQNLINNELVSNEHALACPFDEGFHLSNNLPKPEFILIGVAKGGSTSFSNYLPAHPNVAGVEPKEPNFWTWKYRPPGKYQSMFQNTESKLGKITAGSNDVISGEYTTSYILHPLAPRRMRAELPDVKIILLLRNPIDRAYSHYIMSQRAHLEVLSFEEIIEKELGEIDALRASAKECFSDSQCDVNKCFPKIPLHRHNAQQSTFMMQSESDMKDYYYISYLFRSIYDDSVERWLSVYPREQILFLQSEELFADNESVMQEASKFLELPYFNFSTADVLDKSWGGGASNRYKNPHEYPPISDETRAKLREFFEPYNQRLYQLVGRDFGWD